MSPGRVRKRQGEFRLQESYPAQAGAAAATGNKKGGNQRGINREPKQGRQRPRKRASSGESGKGGESHRRCGKRSGRGSAEGPLRAEAGKKEETKNKRKKTKGQWESIPLTPASLNFGVAVVTASKGQGRGERVGLVLEG